MTLTRQQHSQRRFYFRYFRVDKKARSWGMYVTTCGKSIILPEDGVYPPRQHPPLYHFDWDHGRALDEYQLVYISEGSGLFETKREKIQIRGDNVILLRPGMWHRYRPYLETGWREYWVGFSGPAYKAIFDARSFSDKSVFRARDPVGMHKNFEILIACAQQNGPAIQQMMAAHTCVLLALLYSSTLSQSHTASQASKIVQQAREMMLAAETRDLSLEEMARRLGTSYSNFRSTFCEHTGVGPHQYRLHLKLSQARELLLKTDLSIKEIAYQSGFEGEQYFSRFFKKAMGRTPSNYRKR